MKSLLAITLVGLSVLAGVTYAGKYDGVYGWRLIAQAFDGSGALLGPPIPTSCRPDIDYIKGAIPTRTDCWPDGEYKTLAECKKAIGPHRIDLHQVSIDKLVGMVYFCTHVWSPARPSHGAAR